MLRYHRATVIFTHEKIDVLVKLAVRYSITATLVSSSDVRIFLKLNNLEKYQKILSNVKYKKKFYGFRELKYFGPQEQIII